MALSEFWKTLILTTLPVLVGGGVIVGGIEYLSRDRELDIKMVEIGVAILRVDPNKEQQVAPTRQWAVRLINHYSDVDFTADEQKALLNQPLSLVSDEVHNSNFKEFKRMVNSLNEEQLNRELK